MRKIFLILLMLSPLIAFAQGKQSDELAVFINEYQQIQKVITDKDAVIKYVLSKEDDSETYYKALVMRKFYNFPKVVRIAKQTAIENDTTNFNSNVVKSLLEYVLPFLDGIENVYFQAVGFIESLPIEYVSINDNEMFCQAYNVYRVSAMKVILQKDSPRKDYKTAAVYGGIDYDTDTLTLSEVVEYDNIQSEKPDHSLTLPQKISFPYLRGTAQEAKAIDSTLSASKIQSHLYSDMIAPEETFKNLSGKAPDIIHLSTHIWHTDDDISAILFAGANRLSGCNHLEDGFLTDDEIQKLDLSKTDLLVLASAKCDIYKSFKLAGINSIMMSCWNVYDNPTCMLMSDFYKNLVSGMSKQKSLLDAVLKVKAKYKNPKAWAAFLLLDGLN